MKTLDVQLLGQAHACIQRFIREEGSDADNPKAKKYRTAVKGAPAFIQGCGLAQAVAFWEAKEGDGGGGYAVLLTHLESFPGVENLRSRARTEELDGYIFLTRRVQVSLGFLKRMVDAFLPEEKGEADESGS